MPRSISKNDLITFVAYGLASLILLAYIVYTQISPIEEVKETVIDAFPKFQKSGNRYTEQIRPATKPTIVLEKPIFDDKISSIPRAITSKEKTPLSEYTPNQVAKYNEIPIVYDAIDVAKTKPINDKRNIPSIKPNTLSLETNSKETIFLSLTNKMLTPTIKRGITEKYIRVANSSFRPLSRLMVFCVDTPEVEISQMANSVKLGFSDVQPLPKGEPGGRVIGRGKDIQGVFRFARIRHSLADWWADQTSLVALTEWLNRQTRIKTDMSVEGGSLLLTDPKLLKSPLLFFTGHDPSNVRSRNLISDSHLKGRLSEPERNGLRSYLIDKEGFIFFDDCGVNAPAQEFLRLMMAQIKYAMPEHSVNKIPNNHEVYNNFYEMGGPPVGFDIFWWGTHPPKRNFLEGITINNHLGVIICRRDFMCSMETFSMPSKTVHYSPGVYRFLTNVVIYALTHGKISDYTHYVPENNINDRIPVDKPISVPEIE